ncbi:MAG: hypothetical protein ORN49_00490 [Rhodobacteraceae bacterium]|nr:hypothetical protein [Paracoccaceae bacterium]
MSRTRPLVRLTFLALFLSGLAACGPDPAPMSLCAGAKPVVARIHDPAPPNCPKP